MNGFISMIIISALCLLVGILSIKSGIRKKKVCTELAVAKIVDVHVSYGDGKERNTYSPIYAFEINGQEFDEIRRDIEDRRRKINKLISDGLFSDISLDGDSFGKYLEVEPYENLLNKIASINSMEIEKVSCLSYLPALLKLGFKTLGELDELRRNYFEDAYQLALMQLGDKDIDFISSNIALKNLCIVYILRNSQDPKATLKSFFDELLGEAPKNERMAVKLYEQGVALGFNK